MDDNITDIEIKSERATSVDLELFNPEEYFKDYPRFEIYDNKKKYNEYLYDYGYGIKKYIPVLYTLMDKNSNMEKQYVIYEEEISDEDLKELKEYCRCENCKSGKINFCSCCIGCFKSHMPSQFNINKAREYRKNCNLKV